MDSDDVDVRCKKCDIMGSATVRSRSQRALDKMKWILGRLLCQRCEDSSR